ncbi:MAG: HEAT repeat domain-containing protein [Planctomycetales bacterium]|nr:HEAT repeat domain-containing protein [bacterium]UNM09607.1 MAG: HEAT repeat domain-containing protein [Planctomycetales bacterium]
MFADSVQYLVAGIFLNSALLFLIIVVQRMMSASHNTWASNRRAELLPVFARYLSGDSSIEEMISSIGNHVDLAEEMILGMLRQLTGSERKKLLTLADRLKLLNRTARRLNNWDWRIRDIAAMQLGIYGLKETVPILSNNLRDKRMEVRFTAARSMGMIGTPEAGTALLSILNRPELMETTRLVEIVQKMRGQAIVPLRQMLEHQDFALESKLMAIDLVGDLQEYRLVDQLHEVLRSSHKEKVIRTIKSMGKIASPRSIPEFLRLSKDRSWEIRAQAVKALGTMQVKDGLPILRDALSDPSYWVRRNAAQSLAAYGRSGGEILHQARRDDDDFARDVANYQLEKSNGNLSRFFQADQLESAASPRRERELPGSRDTEGDN